MSKQEKVRDPRPPSNETPLVKYDRSTPPPQGGSNQPTNLSIYSVEGDPKYLALADQNSRLRE